MPERNVEQLLERCRAVEVAILRPAAAPVGAIALAELQTALASQEAHGLP